MQKGGKLDIHDIIIIGAGPAGSELAYRMARKGFDVLVLEKEKLQREKPCGGGIPAQEIIEFGDLPKGVIERDIRKARIIAPENSILEVDVTARGRRGATVRRSIYDSFLQERAKNAGAVFLEKTNVRRIKGRKGLVEVIAGKRYIAKLAADASGYPCSIKGISRDACDKDLVATCHAWIRLPEKRIRRDIGDAIEMYCGRDVIPRGYAWIFPKKDVVSVGIGATMDAIKEKRLPLGKLLRKFIRKHPVASKKLMDGRIVRSSGGIIRTALLPKLYSGSIMFIGDAGGFANPLNGGGIYQARKSAVMAAKHCARFLNAKNRAEKMKALEDYDKEARKTFYASGTKWDIKLRDILWNDEVLGKVIKKAKGKKGLRESIAALLSMAKPHEKSYHALESEMLDIIHSLAAEKVGRYRGIVAKELDLFDKNSGLDGLARHSFFGDAKRLRVSLVLLACDIFKGDLRKASRLAPVYELLHTGSLIHDDIMDNARARRGKKALHNVCGIDKAIVTGDFLFGKTYEVLSRGFEGMPVKRVTDMLAVMGSCTSRCCHGQVMDLELSEKRSYSSINSYLKMVGLKTGSMIEGAMKNGAIIGNASAENAEMMGRIGKNMGIAFQIIDDSMDLLGNNSSKTLQNDLRQGKVTPMLVYAFKNSSSKERKFLMNIVGGEAGKKEINNVVGIYRKTGAIEYAQRLSGVYVGNARKEIERLRKYRGINTEAVKILEEVADVLGYWGMMAD